MEKNEAGLDLLRKPFPAEDISKLPKPTKKQTDCNYEAKKHCDVCGGFHHPDVIHLDYVGHAALTNRLLDADPLWTWAPLAYKEGLPAFDERGGLWINLTVCNHTRIGYGNAEASSYKSVGDREKEVIGDALRNAAMRFGAALDLWRKDIKANGIEYISNRQKSSIMDYIDAKSVDVKKFLTFMSGESEEKIPSVDKILATDFDRAIEALKKAKGEKSADNQ